MIFDPPLVPATLVQRYKRFLFDAVLDDGRAITGSCPNTGSMRGLTAPGSRIWISEHDGALRKYRHRLELVEAGGTVVGINTGLPNRLAEEAIREGLVGNLKDYPVIERERKYGRNSRVDLLLSGPLLRTAYVEVKNVHFRRTPELAEFPDTATVRGTKHLEELGDMAEAGHRAVMLYIVQRPDCLRFRICRDLDPVYAVAFERALKRGVEAYAVKCEVSRKQIRPTALIEMDEPGIATL
ncbi:DNA/RNA nuclease SfsA [Sinorhizobium sp. BG8]|uniref:DNA/RNA nuclease SfsA n=1 Tax=Sinorhizobium sp. BG8 TaxID=2613773 RepID=UPI00193D8CC8|nr:DNA/RNA nuclease SfsA [Sinorhizobium sp. BG8]QRM55388.1 DNA/RNA nuclease SfsA [Sinorhizobium sp. BG8]